MAEPASSSTGDPQAAAANPSAAPAPTADPLQTRLVAELKHERPLISCRFDPTGRYVFAGSQDSNIVRWELATGTKTVLAGHESWVRGMAFDPAGETLVSAGYEGQLLWWPAAAEQPAPVRRVEAHRGFARAVAVNSAGTLIATGGNDNLVRLWNMADGSAVRELAGHARHVYSVAFHPTSERLLSGDLMGVVQDWDLASGSPLRQFDSSALHKYDEGFRADIGGVRALGFARDGKQFVCSGITEVTNAFAGIGNPAVVLFDFESGQKVQQFGFTKKPNGVAWGVGLHETGFVVAAVGGGSGGYLLFWRPDKAEEFHHFPLPNAALDLALHPDGLRLATPHHDGQLRVWAMNAG